MVYEACLTNVYLRTNQLWKMEKLRAPRELFHSTSKNKIIPRVRCEFLQENFTIGDKFLLMRILMLQMLHYFGKKEIKALHENFLLTCLCIDHSGSVCSMFVQCVVSIFLL